MQNTRLTNGKALLAKAEADVFDPLQTLAAHPPLGDVQRDRTVPYHASQNRLRAIYQTDFWVSLVANADGAMAVLHGAAKVLAAGVPL